jgi:ATF/CREB family transcription factor
MLSGPAGVAGDYFDSHIRGGFPTPNESSLRTGLTPGGGGSMFPAPSPGSQAFINSLASGGATPSTLEFHRTAINARKAESQNYANGNTSQAQEHRGALAGMDPGAQHTSHQHFGQHDNDAANGLFLLAQAGNESQSNNQFAMPTQPVPHGLPMSHAQETSPIMSKRTTRNMTGSLGGSISGSAQEHSEMSAEVSDGTEAKPNTRAKSKRTSSGKTANTRRKADETPTKQASNKKAKTNNGNASAASQMDMSMDGMDSDEEANVKEDQYHENGKKMTDEEKRKNFLERNR